MKIGISASLFLVILMAFTQCNFAQADCDRPLYVWFAVDVSSRIQQNDFRHAIQAIERIAEGITEEHGTSYFGAYLVADADEKSYGPFDDISDLLASLDSYASTYDARSQATLNPEESIDSALSLALDLEFSDTNGGLLFLLMAGDDASPITATTATLSVQSTISGNADTLKSRGIEIIAIEKRPAGQPSLLDYTFNQVASVLNGNLAVYQEAVYHQTPMLRQIFDQLSGVFYLLCKADCSRPLYVWFAVDVSLRIQQNDFRHAIQAIERIAEGITEEHGTSYFGAYLVADADEKSYGPFDDISDLIAALNGYAETYVSRLSTTLNPEESIESALSLALDVEFSDTNGGLLFLLMAGDDANAITASTATLSVQISGSANTLKSRGIEIIAIEKRPNGQSSLLDYTFNQVASVLNGNLAVYKAAVYFQTPMLREIFAQLSEVYDLLCPAPAKPVVTSDNDDPADGDDITLTCTSTTSPIDSYKWFFNGEEVSGENSQTYTLSPATIPDDNGEYTCIAISDNVASELSDPLLVALKPRRARLTPTGNEPRCESDSLTLTCATDSEGPIIYSFLQDDDVIQSSASNTYTISSITATDVGKVFTCMASNDAGGLTSYDSYLISEVVPTTILTASTGSFYSPNFSLNTITSTCDISGPNIGFYPDDYLGCWRIEGNAGQPVSLRIDFINLQYGLTGYCYDFLALYDGTTTSAPGLGIFCDLFSGTGTVISSRSSMFVVFRTDCECSNLGFHVTYTLPDDASPADVR